MLMGSITSCKDFVHAFLSLPNAQLFHLTAFVYSRLCYVFITLARIVFLDIPQNRGVNHNPGLMQILNTSWSTAIVAREAQFQHLGKQVLAKFTAVATDYTGPNGHKDAMSALASAMKLLLTGYEQQMNDLQKSGVSTELPNRGGGALEQHTQQEYGVEMQGDDTAAAVASTTRTQRGSAMADLDGAFDLDFAWDATASAAWDDILETFTMSPFS